MSSRRAPVPLAALLAALVVAPACGDDASGAAGGASPDAAGAASAAGGARAAAGQGGSGGTASANTTGGTTTSGAAATTGGTTTGGTTARGGHSGGGGIKSAGTTGSGGSGLAGAPASGSAGRPGDHGLSPYAVECHGDTTACNDPSSYVCLGIRVADQVFGYSCSEECTSASDCSTEPAAGDARADCVDFVTKKYCLLVCKDGDTTASCPAGMYCYAYEGAPIGYCLWQ